MPDGFVVADQILRGDRQAEGAARAPARLLGADHRRPRLRHPRRLPPRPGRDARDHRRRRRRPAARRRLPRPRRSATGAPTTSSPWSARSGSRTTPFDHEGEFYKVTGAWSSVRPEPDGIPIYFGGASDDAIRVGGKHADAYAFWGEPLDGIRQRIAEVRAAAAPYGRNPRFSVSLRPIVADTEEEAWARAEDDPRPREGQGRRRRPPVRCARSARHAVGSQRLVAAAEEGDVHDKRLWTALAKVTGGAGNSTSLVGTYEQVADGAPRLRRPRRHHAPHPRLRPARGRQEVRPRHRAGPRRCRQRTARPADQPRSKERP